jgi:extracellular factor (EF) 3-hydroxypalmitic acid methyl ester biosynthesis protein
MSITTGKDTFILCRNSQGTEFRATLLRLTRYTVVFEVYNPYSILQLSEVLNDFRMIMNDRMVYSGRAVVSNLVNTGILLVCECTLDENWLDVDIFTSIHQKDKLQNEFTEFLNEWEKIHHITDKLKVVIADMQTFLMDMRRWLEQVELSIRSEPSGDRAQVERDAILQLKDPISPAVSSLFERFEETIFNLPQELQSIHRSYSKRQIHPLVLCSPFVYRSLQKPLGYAGDYEMVNMMLRDPFEGSSLFAKLVNLWFINSPPCEAHRNRIKHLTTRLGEETERVVREGRTARFLDMACGPAKEVQNFLIQDDICEKAQFTLLDFNDETLEYTGKILESIKIKHLRRTPVKMVKKSVNHILKEAFKPSQPTPDEVYDFIYCAGLFDYLEDRICKKMMDYFYGLLAPGGLLLATNVTPSNPLINTMESFMEWHLIYRNQEQMKGLKPEAAPENSYKVVTESTGINIFIEVRKPK